MVSLGLSLTFVLAGIALALFGFAVAALYALCTGFFTLRVSPGTSPELGRLLLKSPIVPGVSVIYSPAGAGPEVRAIVRRLLDLHYANSELVLVLDGPAEADRRRWVEDLHLVPLDRSSGRPGASAEVRSFYISRDPLRLMVVEKEAGGRGDAWNAGVEAARYPVLGLVDAEADFNPEFLLFVIRPMLQDWEHTPGVCGFAPAACGRGLAGRIGAIENLRLWLARGAAFSAWNRVVPAPGCCMLVKRDAVFAAGGFTEGPLELFLALHAGTRASSAAQRIAFVPALVSRRPATNSWGELRRQITRDQRMLTAALRGGAAGAGPEFLGLFCMRVLRPMLETAGLLLAAAGLITGTIDPALAALVLLAGAGSGIVISMTAVVLRQLVQPDGTSPRTLIALFLASIPENLGYRQLRNLWLLSAFLSAPKSRATGHDKMALTDGSTHSILPE